MKRTGYLMGEICSYENLYLAFYKAARGKWSKESVRNYAVHLKENIDLLKRGLEQGTVDLGNYHSFRIYDPKERLISATSFDERVLQHAIMNVCHIFFDRMLVYDTHASRNGHGSTMAVDRAKSAIKKYPWVIKMDVRKYFDSIDHNILKSKLRKLFKDPALLMLFDRIIDSYETVSGKGIPIGNLTSQYFANMYLSTFDHYMKEIVRVPRFVRYMDDILIFADNKEDARYYESESRRYLANNCNVELKPSTIVKAESGVSFLGYKLYPHKVLLNRKSKNRLRSKMEYYGKKLDNVEWLEKEYYRHITPLIGFAQKAYTKQLRQHIIEYVDSRRELEPCASWR